MNKTLDALLRELEEFGSHNDAVNTERPRRMLNITRDTGEFLSVLVRATNAKRVLEIGTSNGYSTLWLAQAAIAIGGHVTTIERSDFKQKLAANNFERSGIAHAITQVQGDAADFLNAHPDASYDLIFLDSERAEYPAWQAHLKRILNAGGLLVVDNATSHASEMAPFVALISADNDFSHCTVPVGNGEFLATRAMRSRPTNPA
ncbi:O-methyltransferase [Ferribacterium limneticum]|uniref:O-methyltransferase n=1 Tax=Ferribacterium limneticum TaxID=76259 RepID=UPI001CFC21DE|nr:O-methyltransferase [Ferribacterium limneticum]UCV29860.1 O-methyltransferase [Ferribacterium limneticum]UCV33779.1 O-methyltransferase [Ferribacterium limneticum]